MIGAWIAKRNVPAAFAALNNHDIRVFLKDWRNDATFVYPGDITVSGTYTGRDAISRWFQNMMDQFPSIEFRVKHVAVTNLLDLTGNNVVVAEWEVTMTNKDGFSGENSGITVITTKMGKAVHVKDYIFDTGEAWRKAWNQG